MLAASICAVLSGFQGYTAMAQWIHLEDFSLWHLLGFTRRPPDHDCFRDLLMTVDPDALAEALMKWITIIDGKTLRGTREKHHRAYQTLAVNGGEKVQRLAGEKCSALVVEGPRGSVVGNSRRGSFDFLRL